MPAPGPSQPDTEGPRPGSVTLPLHTLHHSLSDPSLESMNFLNEVSQRYPDAISFAAGRPYEELFDIAQVHRHLEEFCRYLEADRGWRPAQVRRAIFQYGRTKGIVHDLVAATLAKDEGMHVDPEAIVMTVGCQEGLFLVARALRTDARDVALAVAPTYVGFTGAARLAELPLLPVRAGPEGIDLDDLVRTVRQARKEGLRPRACYLVPDFANPLGISLSVPTRRALLAAAAECDLLILEDNPYGLFSLLPERPPTLKALDSERRVIYLGSFAKTAFPGARVGYVIADQAVSADGGAGGLLADRLAAIKSMLTVNTSPLAQAVIGGRLLAHDLSLVRANTGEAAVYRRNLTLMLEGLAARFPPGSGVSWNSPGGGYFLVLDVPFATSDELLAYSGRRHGVLWTPMHHFYAGGAPLRQLRLSFSQLTPGQIGSGLDRLAALVHEHRDGGSR
ncbi:PLP-dependent aminotransferase family protein [Streptomyces harbinensis]|uniref:aminotransferase-like domain-containing protein n=1 Tax=Streptomyces harbinensis TaxID=1176198 RepID=UPI0037140A8F